MIKRTLTTVLMIVAICIPLVLVPSSSQATASGKLHHDQDQDQAQVLTLHLMPDIHAAVRNTRREVTDELLFAQSQAYLYGQFWYHFLSSSQVEILAYVGPGGSVAIPSHIYGYTVTSIGEAAFFETELTAVSIPWGVTNIGYGAFFSNLLAAVSIPSSVTSIGDYAFADNWITSITIPSSVTSLGEGAFCDNLIASATIPPNLTSIPNLSFFMNQLSSVVIPASVTSIGEYAFALNNLTSVSIPVAVTTLGRYAFAGNELAAVTVPSNLMNLGTAAFYDNLITSVTIHSDLISMADAVFYKNKLTSVVIPASVTNIGEYAFALNNLTSVTVPSNVTSIGEYAFAGNSLSTVALPSGITSLGPGAFYDNLLTSVSIPSGLTRMEKYVFSENQLEGVSIPLSVTDIDDYAFSFNKLTSLTIPTNVTSIGTGAFSENMLSSIIIPANVTFLGLGSFSANQLVSATLLSSTTILGDWVFSENQEDPVDLVMSGLLGSTAEAYAYEYGHTFKPFVVAPVFAQAPSGEVPGGTVVSLACVTQGAIIYFTTDGSIPTGSSTVYTTPIILTEDTTIMAVALLTGYVPSDVLEAPYEVYYTVAYKDYDGTILGEERLGYGEDATPPTDPERIGYDFAGWDHPYSNVTSHLQLNAQYTAQQFTITFDSKGGSPVDSILADYDSLLTPPPVPMLVGVGFGGWYKDEGLTVRWNFAKDTVPLGNSILYARWAFFGSLAGQVTDPVGTLAGTQVMVFRAGEVVAQTTTCNNGFYSFEQLTEDDAYSVVFAKNGYVHLEEGGVSLLAGVALELDVLTALLGDVNLDGFVNAADIVPVNRHALGVELITDGLVLKVADLNGDGFTNAADIVPLNRHALGIELLH